MCAHGQFGRQTQEQLNLLFDSLRICSFEILRLSALLPRGLHSLSLYDLHSTLMPKDRRFGGDQ